MPRLRRFLTAFLLLGAGVVLVAGCGVTRSTDTVRTATEQLLISDAIDRAVQTMNLQTLSGQTVFLDDSKLGDTVDRNYYISTLRQQLLANGCELRDQKDQADFVVEARAGAIGTDRNDLLFGIPSMNVPMIPLVQPVPSAIPEIPIAKRKDQRGVAKIAVFAYHRASGTPVWQSGIVRQESSANDVWILGAGPFQRGTIYEGTAFAGKNLKNEPSEDEPKPQRLPAVSVASEAIFTPPQKFAKQTTAAAEQKVVQAAHSEPLATAAPKPATAAATVKSAAATSPVAPKTAAQSPPTPTAASSELAPAAGNATTSTPASIGLSVNVPMPDSQVGKSAYLRVGDANPLPQPRFNSPQ
jgi:hypothetical protein